jgi:hypothetical protein
MSQELWVFMDLEKESAAIFMVLYIHSPRKSDEKHDKTPGN